MSAYIVTGPTSGVGRFTALELAKHGTVILVGRDPAKLADMQKTITQKRQKAVSVVCDLSDITSVRRAAALLALVFAVTWFISTAMAAHLPRLLQAQGLPLATALLLAALPWLSRWLWRWARQTWRQRA